MRDSGKWNIFECFPLAAHFRSKKQVYKHEIKQKEYCAMCTLYVPLVLPSSAGVANYVYYYWTAVYTE